MKKFMSIMLALALTTGVATVTLAQDTTDDTKKYDEEGQSQEGRSQDRRRKDQGPKKGKGKKAKDATTRQSKRSLLFRKPAARGSLLEGCPSRLSFFWGLAFRLRM